MAEPEKVRYETGNYKVWLSRNHPGVTLDSTENVLQRFAKAI
jgi:hypothetical protein